jgi:hypothetical protein
MHATRSFTSLRRRAVAALLTTALAAAAILLAHAASAAADSRACTPESRGCASFKRAGNTFDVCDYGFDGESVAVQNGAGRIIAVNYWGSLKFNGCRRWHVRGHNGTPFKYRVCLARNARPGGKPIRLERFFCSRYHADIF